MNFKTMNTAIKRWTTTFSFAFFDESKRVLTDGGAMLILVGAMMIYPIVYSIAYSKNVVRDVPVAVVDLDNSQSSRTLIRMLKATPELEVAQTTSNLPEAYGQFNQQAVNAIIVVPDEFEDKLMQSEQVSLPVYSDGSSFLLYKQTLSGALSASQTFAGMVSVKRYMGEGKNYQQAIEATNPLPVTYFNLFNPSAGYGYFVMPGIILIILQQTLLVGIGMVGGTRRELRNERFDIQSHLGEKAASAILCGRAIFYLLLSVFNIFFSMIIIHHLFGFPDNGSLLQLLPLLAGYLLAAIFLGLGLSHVFKRREHGIMFLVFLSPIVLFMSGISWPAEAMPKLLHGAAYFFPSTSMLPAYLRVRTMGASVLNIRVELITLWIQVLAYFGLAIVLTKISIRKQKEQQIIGKIAAQNSSV